MGKHSTLGESTIHCVKGPERHLGLRRFRSEFLSAREELHMFHPPLTYFKDYILRAV